MSCETLKNERIGSFLICASEGCDCVFDPDLEGEFIDEKTDIMVCDKCVVSNTDYLNNKLKDEIIK